MESDYLLGKIVLPSRSANAVNVTTGPTTFASLHRKEWPMVLLRAFLPLRLDREDDPFRKLFCDRLSSTTLGDLLDIPAIEDVTVRSQTDFKHLLKSVNGAYYQAHNLVVTRPTYSDEFARIDHS